MPLSTQVSKNLHKQYLTLGQQFLSNQTQLRLWVSNKEAIRLWVSDKEAIITFCQTFGIDLVNIKNLDKSIAQTLVSELLVLGRSPHFTADCEKAKPAYTPMRTSAIQADNTVQQQDTKPEAGQLTEQQQKIITWVQSYFKHTHQAAIAKAAGIAAKKSRLLNTVTELYETHQANTEIFDFINDIPASMPSYLISPATSSSTSEDALSIDLVQKEVEASFKFIIFVLTVLVTGEISKTQAYNALRALLIVRWQAIKGRCLDYTYHPFFPLNQACLAIASAIAEPDEPIISVLMPEITKAKQIIGPNHTNTSLQQLTEQTTETGERQLNLHEFHYIKTYNYSPDRLIHIPSVVDYAIAATHCFFPRLDNRQPSIDVDLAEGVYEHIRQVGGTTSAALIATLEKLYYSTHNLNCVGTQLKILSQAARQSSVIQKGSESLADKETIGPAVQHFYHNVWMKLSEQNRRTIGKLSIAESNAEGQVSLEYCLCMLFDTISDIDESIQITQAQKELLKKPLLLNCTHMLSGRLDSFIEQNPGLNDIEVNSQDAEEIDSRMRHTISILRDELMTILQDKQQRTPYLAHNNADYKLFLHDYLAIITDVKVTQLEKLIAYCFSNALYEDTNRSLVHRVLSDRVAKSTGQNQKAYEKLRANILDNGGTGYCLPTIPWDCSTNNLAIFFNDEIVIALYKHSLTVFHKHSLTVFRYQYLKDDIEIHYFARWLRHIDEDKRLAYCVKNFDAQLIAAVIRKRNKSGGIDKDETTKALISLFECLREEDRLKFFLHFFDGSESNLNTDFKTYINTIECFYKILEFHIPREDRLRFTIAAINRKLIVFNLFELRLEVLQLMPYEHIIILFFQENHSLDELLITKNISISTLLKLIDEQGQINETLAELMTPIEQKLLQHWLCVFTHKQIPGLGKLQSLQFIGTHASALFQKAAARYPLDKLSQPDNKGRTLLYFTIAANQPGLALALLVRGVDTSIRENGGHTAYKLAKDVAESNNTMKPLLTWFDFASFQHDLISECEEYLQQASNKATSYNDHSVSNSDSEDSNPEHDAFLTLSKVCEITGPDERDKVEIKLLMLLRDYVRKKADTYDLSDSNYYKWLGRIKDIETCLTRELNCQRISENWLNRQNQSQQDTTLIGPLATGMSKWFRGGTPRPQQQAANIEASSRPIPQGPTARTAHSPTHG